MSAAHEPPSARVQICRDCCCGTVRKHPDVDHDAQEAALSSVAQTRIVKCVDECAQSNVIIVRFGHEEAVWFGGINSVPATSELCDWIKAGGPQLPQALGEAMFVPKGRLLAEQK